MENSPYFSKQAIRIEDGTSFVYGSGRKLTPEDVVSGAYGLFGQLEISKEDVTRADGNHTRAFLNVAMSTRDELLKSSKDEFDKLATEAGFMLFIRTLKQSMGESFDNEVLEKLTINT